MCELPFTFNQRSCSRNSFSLFTSYFLHHYELLISGFGSWGMIQLINACGERVCM